MTPTLPKQYSIAEYFGGIRDPRYQHRPHRLLDIITIALCRVICGANDGEGVAEFGRAKEEWLRKFLSLAPGMPSTDTFGRIFSQTFGSSTPSCRVTR